MSRWMWTGLVLGVVASAAQAAEPGAAERGKRALLGRSFNPASVTRPAYDTVWRQWGLSQAPTPAEFARLLRERYGLFEAPYPNGDLPMGLREADVPFTFGKVKGVALDCLICHGGAIAGQSYVGLGNTSLDLQAYFEEMSASDGRGRRTPFRFCNVRGTNEAGATSVFLLQYREPDLTVRARPVDLELHDDLCEDVPAWWLLKKKKTMYHTGGGDTRSVRTLMQFMMSPFNPPAAFARAEAEFADIRAYLLTLEPPKYPLPIDRALARRGEELFRRDCSRCHGTYGPGGTYPNRIVPLEEIGTDRRRFDGISRKFGDYYNRSWFGQEQAGWLASDYPAREPKGYQAPPLDGIWATAPYLHNGSVPTVYDVLRSGTRPRLFTRSYRTDLDAYDARKLGWKVQVLEQAPDENSTDPLAFRRVYDTSRPGRGNGGHTFGDHLSDAERGAVIEYLKTL